MPHGFPALLYRAAVLLRPLQAGGGVQATQATTVGAPVSERDVVDPTERPVIAQWIAVKQVNVDWYIDDPKEAVGPFATQRDAEAFVGAKTWQEEDATWFAVPLWGLGARD